MHLGGTFEEIAEAEAEVDRGVMPERPYVLVGQQYLADPTRSAGDVHPIWAYAHVPHAYTGDATDAVLDQIERFAPGFRERIVATHVTDPAGFEAYNPNYVGGDIAAGATTVRQLVARPRPTLDPYATALPGVYLCSASTPPGAGRPRHVRPPGRAQGAQPRSELATHRVNDRGSPSQSVTGCEPSYTSVIRTPIRTRPGRRGSCGRPGRRSRSRA